MEQETGILEGRINAHRKILVELLVVLLADDARRESLLSELRPDAVVQDQEEDPGIIPTDAYAAVARRAEEIRSIMQEALRRVEAS